MSRIKVDFRGREKRVLANDAKRQEATRRLILAKFAKLPGVILCDEVGMGKTYVALGVIAEYLCRYPRSRVLVLTPSSDLTEKWIQDLGRFSAENVSSQIARRMRLPQGRGWRLEDILGARDKSRLWILPIQSSSIHEVGAKGQSSARLHTSSCPAFPPTPPPLERLFGAGSGAAGGLRDDARMSLGADGASLPPCETL